MFPVDVFHLLFVDLLKETLLVYLIPLFPLSFLHSRVSHSFGLLGFSSLGASPITDPEIIGFGAVSHSIADVSVLDVPSSRPFFFLSKL